MINESAKQIVEQAEQRGLSHKDIAKICQVSIGTVSRWKTVGKARAKVIAALEAELSQPEKAKDKLLRDATLEDLAERARVGFLFKQTFIC